MPRGRVKTRDWQLFKGPRHCDEWTGIIFKQFVVNVALVCVLMSCMGINVQSGSVFIVQVVALMAYDMIDGMKQDWYEAGVWLPWATSILGTFFCSFMNAWSGLRTRANKYDDMRTAHNGHITEMGYALAALYTLMGIVSVLWILCRNCATREPKNLERPRLRVVMDALQTTVAVFCMGVSAGGIPCEGWAKQSPLAMVQIVVLFNVDVVLGLINELWDYGHTLGVTVNVIFLLLNAAIVALAGNGTGGKDPCEMKLLLEGVGIYFIGGYVVAMACVVLDLCRRPAPVDLSPPTMKQLRFKAAIKQALSTAIIVAIVVSISGYDCTGGDNLVSTLTVVGMLLFTLPADSADDSLEAGMLKPWLSNHMLALGGIVYVGYAGLMNQHNVFNNCRTQEHIQGYGIFYLCCFGILSVGSFHQLVQASRAPDQSQAGAVSIQGPDVGSPEPQQLVTSRNAWCCDMTGPTGPRKNVIKVDLAIKALTRVVGVVALGLSLLGIPCDGADGSGYNEEPLGVPGVVSIYQTAAIFSIGVGLELSTIFCSHRLRFGAVINLLLTLVAAAYMVVVAFYWLFSAGGRLSQDSAPRANCYTSSHISFIGLNILAAYAGATVVLILPTIPCAVVAGEEGAGGDEKSEQQGADPNMDDVLSGAVAVSTTVV